jgi:hypothetical protein
MISVLWIFTISMKNFAHMCWQTDPGHVSIIFCAATPCRDGTRAPFGPRSGCECKSFGGPDLLSQGFISTARRTWLQILPRWDSPDSRNKQKRLDSVHLIRRAFASRTYRRKAATCQLLPFCSNKISRPLSYNINRGLSISRRNIGLATWVNKLKTRSFIVTNIDASTEVLNALNEEVWINDAVVSASWRHASRPDDVAIRS